MRKKLTIEFVKESFEKYDYELLTKIYINNSQKLEYICPKGHRHSISWSNWQKSVRCPICVGKAKLTIEFVKESFEKYDYELLTKKYINNKQKLDYICPKGHRHSMTWNDWQKGVRCPTCAGNIKLTIEFVQDSFKNAIYELLTKKYINAYQKLEYLCSNGHKHSITWNDWQQGTRCPTCFINSMKNGIESVRKSFEKYNYKLLTKMYIDSHQKLEYICPKGHKHSMSWNNWQQEKRCPTCANISNYGSGNPNWKGGISKEPYCQDWTNDLKELVKERDGHKCMNPDCRCKDKTLAVHHINYNKKFCGAENLITICRSCNSRANTDREWHGAWYKAIIYRRGYKYGTRI